MNKYFLPIISIIILFQSFTVFDEIFYHDNNDVKKGFVIIDDEVELNGKEKSNTNEINSNTIAKTVDLDTLFKSADVEKEQNYQNNVKLVTILVRI